MAAPQAPTDAAEIVFATFRKSYRTPKMIILEAVCLLLLCLPAMAVIEGLRTGRMQETRFLGPLLIAGWFGYISVVGAVKIVRGVVDVVEITSRGVRHEGEWWTWETITKVSAGRLSFSGRYMLRVSRIPKGLNHFYAFHADQYPTRDQCAALLAQLQAWLAVNHPGVAVEMPK